MRMTRERGGGDRLWFDDGEIESIIESELRKAEMLPSIDAPVLDLEAFIERHLSVQLDQYAHLEETVLGLTEFFEGSAPKISINRVLTGSALDDDESPPGIRGRLRATLAHEATHVILHRRLFDAATGTMSLFDREPPPAALQRCLKRNASYGRVTDWREFQANAGMAALLMPRLVFVPFVRDLIARVFPDRIDIPSGSEHRIVPDVADAFKVSKQAASIRLETVGLLSHGQGRLV